MRRLSRSGRVVELPGGPVVRFAPECVRCGSTGACGSGARRFELPPSWLGLGPAVADGDRVDVSVSARGLTAVAAALFAAPLAGLVGGAWLGGHWAAALGWNPDLGGSLVGFAGFAAAAWLAARRRHSLVRMLSLRAAHDQRNMRSR